MTILNPKYPQLSSRDTIMEKKPRNLKKSYNFISYFVHLGTLIAILRGHIPVQLGCT